MSNHFTHQELTYAERQRKVPVRLSWVDTAPFFYCGKIKFSESLGNPPKKEGMFTYRSVKR